MDKPDRKLYMHPFAEVGEAFANYGTNSDQSDIDDFIRTQGDPRLSVMMMAAMVKRLGDIKVEIGRLYGLFRQQISADEEDANRVEKDGLADGMLLVLRATGADVPIALCDESELSIRSQKALQMGNFQSLAEITEEAVLNLRNSGPSTWRELEDWKRLQYGRFSGSNGIRSESLDTGGK